MTENPYNKTCPHCVKKFNARRLNQKYCTYFCKVQFNNSKAKARRLELLEISKKYATKETNDVEVNQEPTILQSTFPTSKVKENSTSKHNWIGNISILIITIFLSITTYLLYRYFSQKGNKKVPYEPKTKTQSQETENRIKEHPTPISLKIREIKSELTDGQNLREMIGDILLKINEVQHEHITKPKEFHPDILAYQKILERHGKRRRNY